MKLDLFGRLAGSRETDRQRRLVEILVGEMRFGVDIMSVSEVVGPGPVIPLPGAPAHVIGVADHRGRVVPVLDLRRRLQLEGGRGSRAMWVITGSDAAETAILVDRVAGVIAVDPGDRREQSPLMFGAGTGWIRGVWSHGRGLVFELDLAAVTGGAREALERSSTAPQRP